MTAHAAEEAIRDHWSATNDLRRRRAYQHLEDAVVDELARCGVDRSTIHTNQSMALPGGYHRAGRSWDVLVIEDQMPVAGIEIISMRGSAFRKNIGNRMDDIVARGADVSRPYDQPSVRELKPALGLLYVLEDQVATTSTPLPGPSAPGTSPEPPKPPEDQLSDFFRRVLRDGMYDSACLLVATPPPNVTVREPDPEMGFTDFAEKIAARIKQVRTARQQTNVGAAELGRRLARRDDLGEVVAGLSSTSAGRLAVDLDVIHRRRRVVAALRELVLDPTTKEETVQSLIGRKFWIFGGQYVGVRERRDGVLLDQYDIPLICADRSIHVIELKRPGHSLVKKQRNHLIVSTDVHEAIGQCMNYLRGLDDLGTSLQTYEHNELGVNYDYRRARGTVVIGNAELEATDGITSEQIHQTIRSYNAHLTRVQVLTYDDLVDSAARVSSTGFGGDWISWFPGLR
ncbi:Shedu anti-phage system protein SduA domain-containing protein [Amycolatopsis sp. NPDC051372]|uniref:Shedu anti-phage system protein SduA domain-containing protein n=1 Tax=Amycolatopsis sp. NPDC051372 TaxID=3155669 RepID=UPI003427E337